MEWHLFRWLEEAKPKTFGELAQALFQIIVNIFERPTVKRVDVTFNRYDHEDSITSAERQ